MEDGRIAQFPSYDIDCPDIMGFAAYIVSYNKHVICDEGKLVILCKFTVCFQFYQLLSAFSSDR